MAGSRLDYHGRIQVRLSWEDPVYVIKGAPPFFALFMLYPGYIHLLEKVLVYTNHSSF